jgi:hypothetical protein
MEIMNQQQIFFTGIGGALLTGFIVLAGILFWAIIPSVPIGITLVGVGALMGIAFGILGIIRIARAL